MIVSIAHGPDMDLVLTLTMNPSIDIGAEVASLSPGRKLRSGRPRYEPGGGGINVARGIRSLGGEVCALYPAGGGTGELFGSLLDGEDLPHRHVSISGITRQNFSVNVTEAGELFHFVMPGPELAREEVEACLSAVREREPRPAYLVASGSLPPGVDDDFYARLAALCSERGIRLVLDTHGEPLRHAIESDVFLIKPNRHEFAELMGERVVGDDAACELSRRLVERSGVEVLVLTLGEEGALMTTREGQLRARPPRIDPVSPVGAGDSFLALCTHRLARGDGLDVALEYGVAGAAAAVLTPGTELFRPEEVERIHAEMAPAERLAGTAEAAS